MKVEIWSDVVCPWCFVGKRRLERAAAESGQPIEVEWRSYELNPGADPRPEGPYLDRLARKYGTNRDGAQRMVDGVAAAAAEDGLILRFDRMQGGNTFDAHRLLHLAKEHGLQDALKDRLFQATFFEGLLVSDHDALVPVAVEVGLPQERVREVLAGTAYAQQVRDDEAEAMEIAVMGVPHYRLDGGVQVTGAQPVATLVKALRRAHDRGDDAPDSACGDAASRSGDPSCAGGSCPA